METLQEQQVTDLNTSSLTVLGHSLTCLVILQVSFISPQEAVFAQERGVPIIDVRPAVDHYVLEYLGQLAFHS